MRHERQIARRRLCARISSQISAAQHTSGWVPGETKSHISLFILNYLCCTLTWNSGEWVGVCKCIENRALRAVASFSPGRRGFVLSTDIW